MAKTIECLLGEYVVGQSSEKVPVNTLCGKDRIVGIYFSAHWCPPCRVFTPILVEFYKNLKQSERGIKFDFIFVSSDRDDEAYAEHFATMPWLALPYKQDKKGRLTKRFPVQGIPKLILLDGETGKTITCDGYSKVRQDPNGDEFPWRRKKLSEVIKGKMIKSNGEKEDALEGLKGKIVGVYFSAHWCPPCRGFTPELVKTYEKLKAEGKNFEVVFVSSDRSQDSFDQYFQTMPWFAIPYDDCRIKSLTGVYEVDGIPTLVIVDEQGEIITINGRAAMNIDKDCIDFPWYPKPLNELTYSAAMQLNEATCLVLFTEGEDEEIDQAKKALQELAEAEHKKGEDQELFFFYGADEEICDSVREFAKLDDRSPLLTILDFPEQKVYVSPASDVTKEVAADFVSQYFAGTLESQSLRG